MGSNQPQSKLFAVCSVVVLACLGVCVDIGLKLSYMFRKRGFRRSLKLKSNHLQMQLATELPRHTDKQKKTDRQTNKTKPKQNKTNKQTATPPMPHGNLSHPFTDLSSQTLVSCVVRALANSFEKNGNQNVLASWDT